MLLKSLKRKEIVINLKANLLLVHLVNAKVNPSGRVEC